MKRGIVQTADVNLAYVDFGGNGQNVLLLHGLMGRATTWEDTGQWLTPHYHVVGLDQRGHGLSSKPDNAYTRDHYVNDVIAVIERLNLAPVIIIGHSMGALNAWVAAARRPDLVRALVLEDMGADTTSRQEQDWWKQWFKSWPIPFPSMLDVRRYFGARRPAWADYFMEVMQETPEGYRPRFSFEHMLQSQLHWETHSYRPELEAITCPALVVKGGESDLSATEARDMVTHLRNGRYVEVPGAGHVIHYDAPAGWRAAVEAFLMELELCSN